MPVTAGTAFRVRVENRFRGGKRDKCVAWDQVALDKVALSGEILVIDEMCDVAGPLTAVKLAKLGAKVRIITKWPMIAMLRHPKSISTG